MNIQDYIIKAPQWCLVKTETGKGFYVNEYTIRNIQLAIAKGEIAHDEYWIDEMVYDWTVTFDKQGCLSHQLSCFSIADDLAMELFILTKGVETLLQFKLYFN